MLPMDMELLLGQEFNRNRYQLSNEELRSMGYIITITTKYFLNLTMSMALLRNDCCDFRTHIKLLRRFVP